MIKWTPELGWHDAPERKKITDELRVGDTVRYTWEGKEEIAIVTNIGSFSREVIFVDTGKRRRWMFWDKVQKVGGK